MSSIYQKPKKDNCLMKAKITCIDETKSGGDGQIINGTTSTPENNLPSGTQSRGTSPTTTASGVGGSEPPDDGRGKPPISGHYRDHQEEGEDELEGPRSDDGITCTICKEPPQSIRVYFIGEESDDVWYAFKGVFCSPDCAEKGRRGKQYIIPVHLWSTDNSSWRPCAGCLEFGSEPLIVCCKCRAFMCGNCSVQYREIRGKYKCPLRCPVSSGSIALNVSAYSGIAWSAKLETVQLPSPSPAFPGYVRSISELNQLMRQENQVDYGTPVGPPTEEFIPPTCVEGAADEECDDPVAEEDLSEEEPQEVPPIPPAPKVDEDEGFEANAE